MLCLFYFVSLTICWILKSHKASTSTSRHGRHHSMEEDQPSATWDEINTQQQPHGEETPASQWVEYLSDSGEVYYTNVVTGETSWTKPGSELEQPNQSHEWKGEDTEAFSTDENVVDDWEPTEIQTDTDVHQDAAVNDPSETVQWLELYDPVQNATYYFAPQSGEICWEPPPEDSSLVCHCDSDAVLSTIVSLQSAARSQQARAKVTSMRQQKVVEHQQEVDKEHSMDNEREQNAEKTDNNCSDPAQSSHEAPDVQNLDPQWMEVFDPVTQQQYYYSPRTSETRWDTPDAFASLEDRQEAAAISIQSLVRGRRPQKQVHELGASYPQHEEQPSLFGSQVAESESEAVYRREMNNQELLQLKSGDRFWGLDNQEREELQKRIEEELLARTEAMNEQCLSSNIQQTNTSDTQLNEDQGFEDLFEEVIDPEQLQRELQDEHDARIAMTHEEDQQCHDGDTFWGIQAEEARQEAANTAMAEEEAASRSFADKVLEQARNATWEVEVQQNATKELAARGGQEERMQTRYLRWFYGQCVSVDELLDYRWPTKQQQERLEEGSSPVKRRQHSISKPYWESVESATPYPLDDLVIRERLEHGDLRYALRSILTIHRQSVQGTHGTRFEITQASPECAFDEVMAAALLKSQILEQQLNREERDGFVEDECQEGELTHGSSVKYRRSRMPDPHIPARFNGVPYKPNQISPTREILSGDHRKLNQLPSLSKPSVEAPKIRLLQKAKTKARAKAKLSSVSTLQIPTSKNNLDSAREREEDENSDLPDENPRAQFKRQEHHVLSKLFALVDSDESGTVNQNEMRWALQRDAEVHALAKTSPLLRLLLKQRTRLEALFSSQPVEGLPESSVDISPRAENSDELSWNEFLARCENAYLGLMSDGLIQPDVMDTASHGAIRSRGKGVGDSRTNYRDEISDRLTREKEEAQTIRRVFALLDNDQNGVLEVAEVQRALYSSAAKTPQSASSVSKELRVLVEGSRALQPMLHQELFMTAFTRFEPLDSHGISEEEFVAFCLEIAHVAAVNNSGE